MHPHIRSKILDVDTGSFDLKDIAVDGERFVEPSAAPPASDVWHLEDRYITPGLIEAHSHLGLCEAGRGEAGEDICETSEASVPQLRALDAFNPFDPAIERARSGGVTVACTGPGSLNVLGGLFITVELAGTVVDEMVIDPAAALKCALGENPKAFGTKGKFPNSRMGIAAIIRQSFYDAMAYGRKKAADPDLPIDLRYEHLLMVLRREIPLKTHVHRADDICTAIRLAREFNLRLTLDHCTEGHKIAPYLAQFDYPIILGPSFGVPGKRETLEKSFATAATLYRHGIAFSVTTDHDVFPQEELITCAARVKKAGVPEAEAFKAVTLHPAQALSIDDRKGSIEPGKDADFVVWSGHPFDLESRVEHVFIRGRKVYAAD
ncbi:MAG: amidohydrolase family protein [Saccharofermentanales bacterium]|jgi:imidazolonepropionase-like amidohydrolase